MIVVYPMMVSNAVSENTLPALGKMMELYILIHMQDDVLGSMNGKFGGPRPTLRYKIKGKKIIGESIDLSEANDEDFQDIEPGTKGQDNINRQDYEDAKRERLRGAEEFKRTYEERKRLEKERKQLEKTEAEAKQIIKDLEVAQNKEEREDEKLRNDQKRLAQQKVVDKTRKELDNNKLAHQQNMDTQKLIIAQAKEERDKRKEEEERKDKAAKVSIKMSDRQVTIEPTWMTVETDKFGTQLIGIKVVPYRVKSDAKLSHLLMHDMKIKGISALTIPLGRKVMGMMLRLTHKGPVTGDPKRDIIYRTTSHRAETFVVLEKNYDVDEYFLSNMGKINRLFKLGWGNFIIADDVLQIAHFCMRAQKGMCQGMSYRMMYKTLGQSGIYEDLEDVRKQNASLFKMKRVRFTKLLGESKAEDKLINYQERQ